MGQQRNLDTIIH